MAPTAAVGLVVVALVPTLGGCTTHQCDAAIVSLGGDGDRDGEPLGSWRRYGSCEAGGGELIWQSSSFVDRWLPFPGQRTYILSFAPLPALPAGTAADSTSVAPFARVSLVQSSGNAEPVNFAQNGGQLAIFVPVKDRSPLSAIAVWNPSCSEYFLRVEVHVPLVCADAAAPPPDSAASDATSAADATTSATDGATGIADATTSATDGATGIADATTSATDSATGATTSATDGATGIADATTSATDGATGTDAGTLD